MSTHPSFKSEYAHIIYIMKQAINLTLSKDLIQYLKRNKTNISSYLEKLAFEDLLKTSVPESYDSSSKNASSRLRSLSNPGRPTIYSSITTREAL